MQQHRGFALTEIVQALPGGVKQQKAGAMGIRSG